MQPASVSLGVTAEAGSTPLLPAAIGWQETVHLALHGLLAGRRACCRVGPCLAIFLPSDRLLESALEIATQVADMPVASLVGTKELLLDARLDAVHAARGRENVTFGRLAGGLATERASPPSEKRDSDFARLPPEDR